jgi:hypothetical protein
VGCCEFAPCIVAWRLVFLPLTHPLPASTPPNHANLLPQPHPHHQPAPALLQAVSFTRPSSCLLSQVWGLTAALASLSTGALVGVSPTDRRLYIKTSLTQPWAAVEFESYAAAGVKVLANGSLLVAGWGSGEQRVLYTKASSAADYKLVPGSCCVTDVDQAADGTYLGISPNGVWPS